MTHGGSSCRSAIGIETTRYWNQSSLHARVKQLDYKVHELLPAGVGSRHGGVPDNRPPCLWDQKVKYAAGSFLPRIKDNSYDLFVPCLVTSFSCDHGSCCGSDCQNCNYGSKHVNMHGGTPTSALQRASASKSVLTASERQRSSSEATKACLASIAATVSLPKGIRRGASGFPARLTTARASFAGSPG